MSKTRIQITEIEGSLLEIERSGHIEKIKKKIDETQYCRIVHSFFQSERMKTLTSEEQIIARGYLAWSYFWPQTIYQELFAKYPLEHFEYKCEPDTDLARYLLWTQDKLAWNPIHWIIYFVFYLPFLRIRLSLLTGPALVGFSIDDERWKSFTPKGSIKIGGGKWRMNSWVNTLPLLHPRKFSIVGDINQKVLAHIKNMNLSVRFLKMALPHVGAEMHFWDDFNYTYPLRLAAQNRCKKVIVHQHAPSFTSIHVTGQIVSQFKMRSDEIWLCWDKEWADLASEMNADLNISIDEMNLPYMANIQLKNDGIVVFPWESFCDNHLKNPAILHALSLGLPVAIKLRSGYSQDLQIKSFGSLPETGITVVSDWKQLDRGARAVVGAQTALMYQSYYQHVPVLVMEYASQTYQAWLDKKSPSHLLIKCRSEQELFSALQAMVGKDSAP